jgi:hypothetical protein
VTIPIRTAIECLSVADALQTVTVQVARLERAGVLDPRSAPEAAAVVTNGPLLAEALVTLAGRMAALETTRTLARKENGSNARDDQPR